MIPKKTVNDLLIKHSDLEKELSSGEIDKKFFAEKSKEYSHLNEIINDAKKYLSFENNKKELEKILTDQNSDTELSKMAEAELKEVTELKERLRKSFDAQMADKRALEEKANKTRRKMD